MTHSDLYISRKSAEKLLDNFGRALKQPQAHPLLFYAYGIGGIGKSTLLDKLREMYAKEAKFARAFFGPTSKIDSPLALMEHLYKQLPDDGWGGDAFTELCKKYKETLNKLETEAEEGKGSASSDQISLVKKLLGGAIKALASWHMPNQAAEKLGSAAEGVVDVASLALSEKDRIEQLLKKHQATRNKRELQELMLDPLPKLTQAFAAGVIQKSRIQPIVLEIDTYEKAPSDFDVFLCKYLLGDTALQSHPIRIVMAGRCPLKNKRYQRMFQQHWNLIYECQLEKFEKNETKTYLKEVGIVQPNEVRRLTQATKGLPYFLRLIKDQIETGRPLNTLRESDEIVDRLLDGLNPTQKQVVSLASYCRWFDRPMIQYLIQACLENKSQSTEEQVNWFDWLIERDFVILENTYRIDDVARDVIRAAEHRVDEQNFRCVHDLLAEYFQRLADQEVAPEQPAPAKYENSDWCRYSAEVAYHTLFANRDKGQFQLLTYFFEGAHLEQPDIAIAAFTAVASEAEPANNELLPKDTQRFLDSIQFAIWFGWYVIGEDPDEYEFNLEKRGSDRNFKTESIKSQIESALGHCFQKVERLTGLAKYTGLMSQAVRCHSSQRLVLVQQAREEAEKITTLVYPQFSSDLFLSIGSAFDSLALYQELLNSYNKAIEFRSDDYGIWNNRGNVLQKIERYEEALDSYSKAIKLRPDYYGAWINQGSVLKELEYYEEAIDRYDNAIKLKPDEYIAWRCRGEVLNRLRQYEEALISFNSALNITKDDCEVWSLRGLCLSFLKRYEEAISSLNKARDLNEKEHLYLANLGIILARAGKYEEAFAFSNQALTWKEDESGHYAKACCYALQGHDELAFGSLRIAIEYDPRRCQLEAKYNPDFDRLRDNQKFQALLDTDERKT